MIKETISEHKPIFILMIITLTLLLIFTVIYFVMPVNAEIRDTLYIISITLIIFTGAFLGYVAVSRLM